MHVHVHVHVHVPGRSTRARQPDDGTLRSSVSLTRANIEGDERMRQEANTFIELVKDLLLRLLEYRDVIDGENNDSKMSCIVGLLVSATSALTSARWYNLYSELCNI